MCVGRMDHHCVWINNCVGCGNHRRFILFVLCQLAYAALFFSVATISLVKELSSRVSLSFRRPPSIATAATTAAADAAVAAILNEIEAATLAQRKQYAVYCRNFCASSLGGLV